MLSVSNLKVSVEGNAILNGLNLEINLGEVDSIIRPNGLDKSAPSVMLAGFEEDKMTAGNVIFKSKDFLELVLEKRAGEGVFLAFQHLLEIPGVSKYFFL